MRVAVSAPGRANPVGAVLSAALMLEDLGHGEVAAEIERCVAQTLNERGAAKQHVLEDWRAVVHVPLNNR